MIEKIQAYRCTCRCGHKWIAEQTPKRCSKCKTRKWNVELGDPFEEPIKPPPEEPPKVKLPKPPKPEKTTVCPSCSYLNGNHQKDCPKNKSKRKG